MNPSPFPESLECLLKRYKGDGRAFDDQAFATACQILWVRLVPFARAMLNGDHQLAENVVQKALYYLATDVSSGRLDLERARVFAWVKKRVRWLVGDELRDRRRHRECEFGDQAGEIADDAVLPIDVLLQIEDEPRVRDWFSSQLDDEEFAIFIFLCEGMTYEEIAEDFGYSKATVCRRWTAARERLKRLLESKPCPLEDYVL